VREGVHRRTPLVVTFHGNFVSIVRASVRRQLARPRPALVLREQRSLARLFRKHVAYGNWHVFRPCEVIVPSHQQLRDTCRSHRLARDRVHVVPNGVDVSVFRPGLRGPADGAPAGPTGFTFICVGRLDRGKGTDLALAAFSRLRDRVPRARLLVVGDGPERERLEASARTLGVAERVVFAGVQPRDAVAASLASADVFLFPTELAEAAPLVLLQAMASGLPVIASNRGGIPEVLSSTSGAPGFLVSPGDVDALASRMLELYDDRDLRRDVALRARSHVCASYTLDVMIERTVEVYEIARSRMTSGADDGT
jgi:glycosyltransferase involved in cell wall biosynthesis